MDKGTSFLTDTEKMIDFFRMCKFDFLESYSYLDEGDYDATCYDILDRLTDWKPGIDPADLRGPVFRKIIDGIQKQKWLLNRRT